MSLPKPQSETPPLLEIQVRSLMFFFSKVAIKFSGIPQIPNPPHATVDPSLISLTASSQLSKILAAKLL